MHSPLAIPCDSFGGGAREFQKRKKSGQGAALSEPRQTSECSQKTVTATTYYLVCKVMDRLS